MKVRELVGLGGEDLAEALKNARRELFELHFKLAVGQLDNHREIRKARKDIAKILTVIRQRELGIGPAEPEDELGIELEGEQTAETAAQAAPEAKGAEDTEAGEEPETEVKASEPERAKAEASEPEPAADEKAPKRSPRRQPAKEDE